MQEKYVQRAVLDYLTAERIFAIRMNSGAQVIAEPGRKTRVVSFGMKGMADVLAMPLVAGRPHPVWIECKSSTGRQRPEQVSFEEHVTELGHTYLLVCDVDELRGWWESHKGTSR